MDVNEAPKQEATAPTKVETVTFDPSRMVGIIKRKALIKDLAAAYHTECVAYCRELLQLQRKWEEQSNERRIVEESRKRIMKPPKRAKKGF